METCPGCFGVFPPPSLSVTAHPYIGASLGCWSALLEVVAKNYQDPAYAACHRLLIDAYGAQHPGNQTDRRARQSAHIHLKGLYLALRKDESPEKTLNAIRAWTKSKKNYAPLTPLTNPTWLTIDHVAKALSALDHCARTHAWAESILKAYESFFHAAGEAPPWQDLS